MAFQIGMELNELYKETGNFRFHTKKSLASILLRVGLMSSIFLIKGRPGRYAVGYLVFEHARTFLFVVLNYLVSSRYWRVKFINVWSALVILSFLVRLKFKFWLGSLYFGLELYDLLILLVQTRK